MAGRESGLGLHHLGSRPVRAAAPFVAGSVYANFMPEDESGRVENAYGTDYRRLAGIKRCYADNRFRMNQNIPVLA